MNEDQLKKYKLKLEGERNVIISEIKNNEQPVDFGEDIDHGEEEADKTEEESNRLAVSQDLRARIDEIDNALERIKKGTYGICESCNGPIDPEILDIDPESRFCKKDKTR